MAWREIIYEYDGSFEGLLCCVFESYTQKERPTAILCDGDDEPSLFAIRAVATDRAHARRIYRSLFQRSPEVGPFLRRALIGNIGSLSRLHAEFLADIGHIHLKFFHTAFIRIAPDSFDDCGIRHHFTAMLGQQCHDIILRLGQLDFPALNENLSGIV